MTFGCWVQLPGGGKQLTESVPQAHQGQVKRSADINIRLPSFRKIHHVIKAPLNE